MGFGILISAFFEKSGKSPKFMRQNLQNLLKYSETGRKGALVLFCRQHSKERMTDE